MSTELAPSKAQQELLRRDRAMRAARKIDVLVARGDGISPSVVDTLWAMLNDDSKVVLTERTLSADGTVLEIKETEKVRVDSKQKIVIAQAFMRVAALRDLVLAERGLSKHGPRKVENHLHVTNIFNKTEAQIEAMEPAARELYLSMALAATAAVPHG